MHEERGASAARLQRPVPPPAPATFEIPRRYVVLDDLPSVQKSVIISTADRQIKLPVRSQNLIIKILAVESVTVERGIDFPLIFLSTAAEQTD